MCPQMFQDINHVMGDEHWIWQQDGARPHTAVLTVEWLRDNTPELIHPNDWPSKSPDLNVMDYSIWSYLLSELQSHRMDIENMNDLKEALTSAWNSMSLEFIRSCISAWPARLQKCVDVGGRHFEHL